MAIRATGNTGSTPMTEKPPVTGKALGALIEAQPPGVVDRTPIRPPVEGGDAGCNEQQGNSDHNKD